MMRCDSGTDNSSPTPSKRTEPEMTPVDERDRNTPDNWIPRNRHLIRLTGRHPFNSEPPLEMLMEDGWITSTSLHYVRNHGAVPRLDWDTHTLAVSGLVKNPRVFTMTDLLSLPRTTLPVTLVCAGNRRKEQNMIKSSIGFPWGPSAVSTAIWSGVLLIDLIAACGGISDDSQASFITFEGELPKGVYGTSVRVETALDPRSDLLVAFECNGERLTPDHGFPVRMIIPGFIGGRMVKWLGRIGVQAGESSSFYHYKDNRVLPVEVLDAEMAEREGWWTKPDYIINELNINSAISSPHHSQTLQIPLTTPSPPPTPFTFRGYAYSGGGRKITRVELTFNSGRSWIPARVHSYPAPHQPRHGGTRQWCWVFWEVEVGDVLKCFGVVRGVEGWRVCGEVGVRAWDGALNTQPEMPTWNLMYGED
ncbi:hypothetical protein HDU67_000830 [Dinochytrium kinnereticum]|nr:hypothetical protein HDU67_000830 [Dinochytrium kinnereticum]